MFVLERQKQKEEKKNIGLDLRRPTASSDTWTSGGEEKLKVLVEFVCQN